MAYPVVKYNSSTGSNTAPSDAVAISASGESFNYINAVSASNTLTFDSAVDLTGVADDDSDYVWVNASSGRRHLYQITACNPSVGACTSLTVAEAVPATITDSIWHINGSRLSLESDSSNEDYQDWESGWVIEFEAGTYTLADSFDVGQNSAAAPGDRIRIQAASGAVSRPIIQQTSGNRYPFRPFLPVEVSGMKFTTTVTANAYGVAISFGPVVFDDCVFDLAGSGAAYCLQANGASCVIVNCYITGGDIGLQLTGSRDGCSVQNCVFDGKGTEFLTAAIQIGGKEHGINIDSCLVLDSDGDGIRIVSLALNDTMVSVTNCTIVDCDGDGIVYDDTGAGGAVGNSLSIRNNLIAYNGLYGLLHDGPDDTNHILQGNAVYSNTSGNYSGFFIAGDGAVTLTADPFTNRASDDYTLNNTAGGGALLREAAYPATLPDGT